MVSGPWDNVQLPGPPNGPAWAQAAAQLMGATQNSINSGANAFQGWQNFNYQQAQRDFFQNPQNQQMLHDTLQKYGYAAPLIESIIQQGGTQAAQPFLQSIIQGQANERANQTANGGQFQQHSSGPATSTQAASHENITGQFSQPNARFGYGDGTNLNEIAGKIGANVPDQVLQRIATSVGVSSPEDGLTEDQAGRAQVRLTQYLKRNGIDNGGVQGGASPDRGGGNPVAQAGTGQGMSSSPQGLGGSGATSPRPTSGSGGFSPSSGAATPNVPAPGSPNQRVAQGFNQAYGNQPVYEPPSQQKIDAYETRGKAALAAARTIGISKETAESYKDQGNKDIDTANQLRKEREEYYKQTQVAGQAKKRELSQVRYDTMDKGIQESDRAAFLMDDHTHAMFGILQNPNLFTGATQAQRQWLRQMVQNYMPGADPNTTLPNEALRKVTAQNLQNQLSVLKADAQEAGESAGRVMLAQIRIMQDAAQNPDSSTPTLRYLTELGARASNIQHKIAQLSRDYKAAHDGELDSGFDQVLADFMKKPENKMLTPREERDISYLSAARLPTNIKNAQEAHAWAREHGIHAGEHLRINSTYPAQYIDYDPNAK